MKKTIAVQLFFLLASIVICQAQTPEALRLKLDKQAEAEVDKVITWRRHIHQYPELSNREVKTAQYVVAHLKKLGLKVQTNVAVTGVVALLETGKPGPVVALRADMDALPVTERNDLPFASKVTTTYNGQTTGVMHACGHDSHVAILMGVAEVLSKNKKDLRGSVKFIFQPAEEGPPKGEAGGASLMVKEGALKNPAVDAIFGLHIQSTMPTGMLAYKAGGIMAASDWFTIKVKGRQTHGAAPWQGVDPIVVSAQIIMGLQTVVSRQTNLTQYPAVVTVGKIQAGVRENIIPEEAVMAGTIRTLDVSMQDEIHRSIKNIATQIASSAGASAEVVIKKMTPVTYNDPILTGKMVKSLERATDKDKVIQIPPITGAEDFSEFQKVVPGMYFFLGAMSPGSDPGRVPAHHTPDFMIDEDAFITGLKAMLNVTVDYMYSPSNTESAR